MARLYVPRAPASGVLYGVVHAHLSEFLATVEARTDGAGLPAFVTAEFRKFLRCGVLAHGFARVRCGDGAFEADVLACPRCGGRMVVLATIDDPAVLRRILTHLGLSTTPGEPAAGRGPPRDDESSA